MSKCRIVERIGVNGRKSYVIQQKHFLFKWWWVDAWINRWWWYFKLDSFDTLNEAKENLRHFDGSRKSDVVVYEND